MGLLTEYTGQKRFIDSYTELSFRHAQNHAIFMQICILVNRCSVISNGTINRDLSWARQSAVVSLELCCSKGRCATFNGGQQLQWMRYSLKETRKGNKTETYQEPVTINVSSHVLWLKENDLQSWTEWSKELDMPGADEQELATPILSLCHGIFTDWSIFSTPFLWWKKGSSGLVTQWRQLVFCDWLWHSHGSLI